MMANTRKRGRTAKTRKAWSGRFTKPADARAERFASSLAVDLRLLPYDIVASQAHAEMLGRQGIVTRVESRRLIKGLDAVAARWRAGKLVFRPGDEDVHMLVERVLGEILGPLAGKLHTARSRNDQVATDLKLYLRDGVGHLAADLRAVQSVLADLAEKHLNWIMPGYTHMQVAQPVLVSHWLLAHVEALARDERRFEDLLAGGLDELPLGAAALAGTGHPIDRRRVARALGFARVTANSMDTVADRDFCAEFLAAAALCAVHLSRLAEEIVWFSGVEFGFITVEQACATGASIMPQKRNPDIVELVRGRTGRLVGNWTALMTTLKGLPLTYNRDLQEDKPPVFDSLDALMDALEVLTPMLAGLTFHRERLAAACSRGFPTATEAADHLVRRGVPFREAHEAVGKAVTAAAGAGADLADLTPVQWRRFHAKFGPDIARDVGLNTAVARKASAGGTAPRRVRRALAAVRRCLARRRENRD
mgnify:CR=1 FL=1